MCTLGLLILLQLAETEKEVEALVAIWEIASNWEDLWNSWKRGEFSSLNVESMESTAAQFNKQVREMFGSVS